ncbi:MAG: hypothetical protein RSE97_06080 [Oscillospiraceae bacterium]
MPEEMELQPMGKSVRTRKKGDEHNASSIFYLDELRQARDETGMEGLDGASAAVLSAFDETPEGETEKNLIELQDSTGEKQEKAEEQELGFGGKVGRFFSRSVDFSINGTHISGKNGYQVRGGSMILDRGAALDLAPAQLVGRRSGSQHIAEGSGAQLFIAPEQSGAVTRQAMTDIYLDKSGTIRAVGTEPSIIKLANGRLELGTASILQIGGDKTATLSFAGAKLKTEGENEIDAVAMGNVCMDKGKLSMEHLLLNILRHSVSLDDVTLDENALRFNGGEADSDRLEGGVIDGTSLTQAVLAAAAPKVDDTKAAASPVALASALNTAPTAEEKAAGKVGLYKNIADGLMTLDSHDYNPGDKTGTANFALRTSLLTTGKYGLDMGWLGAYAKNVKFTTGEDEKVSAELGDMTLEVENEELKDYKISLTDAQLQDGHFSASGIKVIITKEGGIEGSHDGEGLAALLNFSIPKMPEGSVFSDVTTSGTNMEAAFSRVTAGKYAVNGLGGVFSGSLDLESEKFSLKLEKESDLAKNGFFSESSIPIAEVPILPGLTFGLSLKPEAKMSGGFELAGDLPGKAGNSELGGLGDFSVKLKITMNADLELGAGQLAALYVGLTGGAEVAAGAKLGVNVNMERKDEELKAKSLDLEGGVDAALKGSIGAHAGFKLFLWDVKFFSYTFKEWTLAMMTLSASVSKDMEKGILEGWHLENSDFTAEAFGKVLTKDKLNIQANEEKLMEAIKLEDDYNKLKANLTELVHAYKTIGAKLATQNGEEAIINMDDIKAQAVALTSIKKQLEEHAQKELTEEEDLNAQFITLEKFVNEEREKTKDERKKHENRLHFLGNAKLALSDNELLTYEESLQEGKQQMRSETETFERNKLNVYDTIRKHEQARLAEYKGVRPALESKSKTRENIEKHEKRIARLEALNSNDSIPFDIKNKLMLNEAEGDVADSLRKQLEANTEKQLSDLDSEAGFRKAEGFDEEAFNNESAAEKIEQRLLYERGRYEAYDNRTAHEQLDRLVERQGKLLKIKNESKKIQAALVPVGALAGGTFDQGGAAAVFQTLRVLLDEGAKLQETSDSFDYVNEAAASGAQQRKYLLDAMSHIGK